MKLIYTDDLIAFLQSPTAKFPLAIKFSILDLYLWHPQKRRTRVRHSKVSLVSLCELPGCCSQQNLSGAAAGEAVVAQGAEGWPDARQ